MAKYCKYCGKQLNDGVCDCLKAVSAAEAKAKAQVIAAMQANEQTEQFEEAEKDFSQKLKEFNYLELLNNMKKLIIDSFTLPIATLEKAMWSRDKISQYMMTAVFAIIMLLAICIMGSNTIIKGHVFSIWFSLVIASLALRYAYAGGVYLIIKRKDESLKLNTVMALFSVLFIFDTLMVLIIMLLTLLSLYELSAAALLFWLIISAVLSYLATVTLAGHNEEISFKITLVLQLAVMIISIIAIRAYVSSLISSMMNSLGRWY